MAPMNWDPSDGGAERLALSVGVSGALVTGAQALVLEQGWLGNQASFILSAVRECVEAAQGRGWGAILMSLSPHHVVSLPGSEAAAWEPTEGAGRRASPVRKDTLWSIDSLNSHSFGQNLVYICTLLPGLLLLKDMGQGAVPLQWTQSGAPMWSQLGSFCVHMYVPAACTNRLL